MKRSLLTIMLLLGMAITSAANTPGNDNQTPKSDPVTEKDYAGYLFVYFTGNHISQEAICFAVSYDGFNYRALNGGRPVLDSKKISSTGGMRDPHILRGEDGRTFYMVATDMVSDNGWDSNRAMVLMRSTDLVNWTHSVVNMQKRYEGQEKLKRVWAPQTIYDPEAGKYMIYWSMKYGDGPDVIYYAYANDSFTDLEGEPKPLFIPENRLSCIDGDIVLRDGVYHLFYKTEGNGNGIKSATSTSLTSGKWEEQPDYKQQTTDAVEGAGTFKLIGENRYILMYDVYMRGRYQFTESDDLRTFRAIDHEVMCHGFRLHRLPFGLLYGFQHRTLFRRCKLIFQIVCPAVQQNFLFSAEIQTEPEKDKASGERDTRSEVAHQLRLSITVSVDRPQRKNRQRQNREDHILASAQKRRDCHSR